MNEKYYMVARKIKLYYNNWNGWGGKNCNGRM